MTLIYFLVTSLNSKYVNIYRYRSFRLTTSCIRTSSSPNHHTIPTSSSPLLPSLHPPALSLSMAPSALIIASPRCPKTWRRRNLLRCHRANVWCPHAPPDGGWGERTVHGAYATRKERWSPTGWVMGDGSRWICWGLLFQGDWLGMVVGWWMLVVMVLILVMLAIEDKVRGRMWLGTKGYIDIQENQ